MAVLDAKLPASQASTKAVTPTKAEAKVLSGTAPLVIDGGTLGSGKRVLLKDQTKAEQNGLFEVTTNEVFAGTGLFAGAGKFAVGSEWVLTRTADADSSGEVTEGMLAPIEGGATNSKTSWIQRTPGPIEVGVTAQTFESLVAGALGVAGGDLSGLYPNPTIGEPTEWIAPTLENGWSNYGAGFGTVAYRKDNIGYVHLRGLIKGGTATIGIPLFALPAGFRPLSHQMFGAVDGNDNARRVDVESGGVVRLGTSVNNTYLSLSGITFKAEA